MAADCLKIKSHLKINRKKLMERNFKCAPDSSESVMKILPQADTPPPKPPRRRYSDQMLASSLGTLPTSKKHEGSILKHDSKTKICSAKPTYLSLPANMSSNLSNEYNDLPTILQHSFSLSDKLKGSEENETDSGNSLEKFHSLISGTKQTVSSTNNRYDKKDKNIFVKDGTNFDNLFSKYQNEHLTSHSADKLIRSPFYNSTNLTINCDGQNLKSSHLNFHRRHHSDSAIPYFSASNQSISKKSDLINNLSSSSKKLKKCDSKTTCTCCKKNHFILQEIQILKEINEKLWQHLCSVQTCLESLKKKTFEESTDVSISGLLSSMYYAQKAKDCAMEERLNIALKERDAALLEIESLMCVLTENSDASTLLYEEKELNEGIKDLLQEIGYSFNPSRLLKYQRLLLAHICRLKESKEDVLSHKLRCVVVERDNALEKVTKLEEELKGMKLCFELWNLDNKNWELTLFEILQQLIHQRDNMLPKVTNSLDIGSIFRASESTLHSLDHYGLSRYQYLSKGIETNTGHQLTFSESKQNHAFGKSEEINRLREEILFLNTELDSERMKREQAESKCVRLERLILTLRKKLNGQNIGVPV